MKYTRTHLVKFLHALDDELPRKMTIVIIGGASLSLAYVFTNTTVDVDLLKKMNSDLSEAIERAKIKTNLEIKVSTADVRAEILNLEKRLFTPTLLNGFKKLQILIPEKHDIALMKAARMEARDLEDIRELHFLEQLDSNVLFERFQKEVLPLVSGSDELAKARFLEMIDSLFGEDKANEFEKKI